MGLLTVEVELDYGLVIVKGADSLPTRASALLTILPAMEVVHDPLVPDPELQRVIFHEDPASPLKPEDWPEAAD